MGDVKMYHSLKNSACIQKNNPRMRKKKLKTNEINDIDIREFNLKGDHAHKMTVIQR